jgi:hypothetical protein
MSNPLADLALARRLELTEAHGSAAFVDEQARREPYSGAIRTTVAGTSALFAGVGSPITQTFGLGVHERLTERDLDTIERFFTSRGSAVPHEVCPLAGVDVTAMLVDRGYKPIEMSNVLFQGVAGAEGAAGALRVRRVDRAEADRYGALAARGWSEFPEVQPFIQGFARSSVAVATCFIAELDGQEIATAALFMHGGVALLAGASTVPEGRRHGAQQALLSARLAAAAANGCDVAMMVAAPGSASQRNAERRGFRIAYTRTKWQRE